MAQIHSLQTQQVSTRNDVDGDHDGSHAGEVESAEHGGTGNTGNLGSNIDVKA